MRSTTVLQLLPNISYLVQGIRINLKHLVRTGFDARNEVGRAEGRLLDLGEVVARVSVENEFSDLPERELFLGPDFGQVERVEGAGLGLGERHHLDVPVRKFEQSFEWQLTNQQLNTIFLTLQHVGRRMKWIRRITDA